MPESTHRARFDRTQRGHNPMDPAFPEADLRRLVNTAPFRDMDPANFPKRQPLAQILASDTRLRSFRKGEIIVRAGDHGSSAFMVISGGARVVLSPQLPPKSLGRREQHERSLWRVVAQLWSNHRHAEVRSPAELGTQTRRTDGNDGEAFLLQDVPRVLDRHKTALIGPGEFFGEIAALSRMPRTATIFADSEGTELLEIRWQGLRDLLKHDPALRAHIDRLYRSNTLSNALRAMPLFRHLTEERIERVKAAAQFGTYGDYDWSGDYKRLAKSGQLAPERETAIASEGDYPDGILVVRSGFARLTRRFAAGQRTIDYLGAGRVFGLRELVHNWRNPAAAVPYQNSLRVIGHTHTLFIPTAVLEEVVLPGLPKEFLPEPFSEAELLPAGEDPLNERPSVGREIGPETMEFLAENRFFNGTAAMVIDLDRCTRCDDCVRACAATHDNNPRFLRHGPASGRLMIAQACMHCADPVCMIGCPTGAIHRDAAAGSVVINQSTCIGCSSCSNNCPYEAIRMVETRTASGDLVVDHDARPILKATKCDLCIDQYGGPACQRACPHDALERIDMNHLGNFAEWVRR